MVTATLIAISNAATSASASAKMPLIEGIGDEVLVFFGVLLLVFFVLLAWFSTSVSEQPLLRATVFVIERQQRQPLSSSSLTLTTTTAAGTAAVTSSRGNNVTSAGEVVTTTTAVGGLRDGTKGTVGAASVPTVPTVPVSVAETAPSVVETVSPVVGSVASVAETIPCLTETVSSVAESVPSVAETLPSIAETLPSVPVLESVPCNNTTTSRTVGDDVVEVKDQSLDPVRDPSVNDPLYSFRRRKKSEEEENEPTLTIIGGSELYEVDQAEALDGVDVAGGGDQVENLTAAAGELLDDADFVRSSDDGTIRVRLKFLNDTQRLVEGKLEEQLGEFKRRCFRDEIQNDKLIRLIFNGQLLRSDSETLQFYGLFDNCVLHCQVSQNSSPSSNNSSNMNPENNPSNPNNGNVVTSLVTAVFGVTNAPPAAAANNGELDLSRLMLPLFGVILGVIWYYRIQYRQFFNVTSTFALLGITGLFFVSVAALFVPRRDGNVQVQVAAARNVQRARLIQHGHPPSSAQQQNEGL